MTPGPTLIAQKPDMFWGVITSMFIGNMMLLVLNLPSSAHSRSSRNADGLPGSRDRLACVIGAYGVNNNPSTS